MVNNSKGQTNQTMADRKEYQREYHKAYHKNYYRDNIDKLTEYRKEHKDEKAEYDKQYRIDNSDKIEADNIQIICDVCGLTTSKLKTARHKGTNKCKTIE
jgi:hypothetical protein